jgi:glycosyltransferase involved in cell wall biosynthesis
LNETAKADHIIAVSETAKREFLNQFPECADRTSVVYEGVDEQFTPRHRHDDPAILARYRLPAQYILSVSTLMNHKRFDALIRTFARFKQLSGSSGVLAIAGDDWSGHRKTLEKTAKELGVGDEVRFLGHVPAAHLPALYRSARMFVLLSACESFGLPAVEAMACGCPTIVAGACGLAEVVADSGLHVDPVNVDGAAETLLKLHTSADERSALSVAGQLRAAEFSWDTAAKQTIAIFETLLGRRISAEDPAGRINERYIGKKDDSPLPEEVGLVSPSERIRLPIGVD